MTVTYSPHNRACADAIPMYCGAPVRRDALELHASCDGIYRGGLTDDAGTAFDGTPCRCECHTPAGLPDWMRPQEGAALEEALATEAQIRAITEHLEHAHPILGPGRLADVVGDLRSSCPTCGNA